VYINAVTRSAGKRSLRISNLAGTKYSNKAQATNENPPIIPQSIRSVRGQKQKNPRLMSKSTVSMPLFFSQIFVGFKIVTF
jgi:hypothetical protein